MQCWDGYAEYCRWLGVPYANCTTTGYVRDIWDNRHTNGTLNHFVEVEQLEPGDVVVFSVNSSTPLSHIAIFDSDAGGGYGYFLGQNQGGIPNAHGGSAFNIAKMPYSATHGGSAFNIAKMPYSATYKTAFRPKKFLNTTQPKPAATTAEPSGVKWIAENGTMTTKYDIYVREGGPSTKNSSPYKFKKGSRINYDAYAHNDGFVWIRQKRASGGYWYIPTGDSDGNRRTGEAWGTFE